MTSDPGSSADEPAFIHQAIRLGRLDALVIVARIDVAPEALPVLANDHVATGSSRTARMLSQ
jgi:hypothetical protein